MALKDIMFTVGRRTGHSQWRTDTITQEFLRDLINEAAEEIYESIDAEDYLKETVIELQTGQIVSLPSDLQVLRGVRRHEITEKWELMPGQVSYFENGWKFENNLFKSQAVKALKQNITSTGLLTLTAQAVEDPVVVVTIVGSNTNSARVTEEVTMDATSKVTTNSFETIETITKAQPSVYDITVADTALTEIAVVPNYYLASRYRHVEVLEYVFQSSISTDNLCFDIIYKPRLIPMWNGNDPFIIPDFDKAIATQAVKLHFEDQEGKEGKAVMLANKAKKIVDNKRTNRNTHLTRKVETTRNHPYVRRSSLYQNSAFY